VAFSVTSVVLLVRGHLIKGVSRAGTFVLCATDFAPNCDSFVAVDFWEELSAVRAEEEAADGGHGFYLDYFPLRLRM
jgi:ABC-type Fe2+-enterobactin transport system substrate-binding protein